MSDWHFFNNGVESGPHDTEFARSYVRENPGAWCWGGGVQDWRLVCDVAEIRRMKKDGTTPFPRPPEGMISAPPLGPPAALAATSGATAVSSAPAAAPAVPESVGGTASAARTADASEGFGAADVTAGIDFRIHGHEMQFVEIELDPGESAVAEAGAMMYKTARVDMKTIFGDGAENADTGILGRLLGAGQRLLTSESLFMTVFTQEGGGKGRVAFGGPFPGTIMALKLSDYGGRLICQKDSFLAGAKGVQIGIAFQRRILTGLFGGEGFIMQKLEGDGWIFVHMGGTIHRIELEPGETLHVDTGCLAALTAGIDYDVQRAGGVRTMLFGGEGLFFATLTGPGTVWLQSLPFSRLAGRMLQAAPQGGGQRQGEGSVLGGLGDLLGGR